MCIIVGVDTPTAYAALIPPLLRDFPENLESKGAFVPRRKSDITSFRSAADTGCPWQVLEGNIPYMKNDAKYYRKA